jgi:hypothetical protein
MLNFQQEPSFEQGLKDAINKLTNQLPSVQKNPYESRQVYARIQVFKRALQLLNDLPERTSSSN